MERGIKGKPKPCPFCGCNLVWTHLKVDVGVEYDLRYWYHPKTLCFLDCAEIYSDDVPSWNQRA